MKPKQTSETEKPDIVERLHAWSGACLTPDQVIQCAPSITNILREAAAEIERLRAELQARRAAEAKAVEVDLPDYLRFGEPDMFPPAQK